MAESEEPHPAVSGLEADPNKSYTFSESEVEISGAKSEPESQADSEAASAPNAESGQGKEPRSEGREASPPSPTSVSSLSSSDSTSKLINSLSMKGLNAEKDEQGQVRTITKQYEKYSENKDQEVKREAKDGIAGASESDASDHPVGGTENGTFGKSNIVVSPVLPKPVAKPAPQETISKKPIKFTVRKVSREEDVGAKRPEPRHEYLYGNVPEHRAKLELRKANDKKTQLQQNQEKYDSYVVRSDKIEKEIRFLANLLPPYNVEIDYATRNKITRAIEKLRMKKDEIDKKKYSLGISISRLWREYDENSTWVRSVSNQ